MERQGSFQLLRNLLGSIVGGLSSLAGLPFSKRKTPEIEAPPPSPPHPFTGSDHGDNKLSKLYPDMEFSASQKRVRLPLEMDKGECSTEKTENCSYVSGSEKLSREGSGETSDGFATPILLNEVSYGAGTTLDECDVTTFGSGVLQGGSMTLHTDDHSDDVTHGATHVGNMILCSGDVSHGGHNTSHIPDASDEKVVNDHDETLHDLGDDSNDNLASFRRTVVARKLKQKKRVQDSIKEEELPRKRVRFGNTPLDLSSDAQSSLSAAEHGMGRLLKMRASSTNQKRVDGAEDKNEIKPKALTSSSEETVFTEGKTSMLGTIGVSTRKRERTDDESAHLKSVNELQNVVLVENLPLTATRKAISKEFSQFGAIQSMQLRAVFFHEEKKKRKQPISGEINRMPNSQNARIVYKDEISAKAALARNMKEFNGNLLRVIVAGAHGTSKETTSAVRDDTWSIVVHNTPIDVKDEELFQLFGSGGSLKLDVTAVRVTRDPSTGLSKGTAHVFFKTEADINFLLSLRRTLKLRDRVLRVSRASDNTQREQRLTPPRLAKRSIHLEPDESTAHEKQAKSSLSRQVKLEHRSLTRSNKSSLEGPKEHVGVHISSSHIYTTRHVLASMGQKKNPDDSPEAKGKRVDNLRRGISRSKIRTT